jgi:hypothetical protein
VLAQLRKQWDRKQKRRLKEVPTLTNSPARLAGISQLWVAGWPRTNNI